MAKHYRSRDPQMHRGHHGTARFQARPPQPRNRPGPETPEPEFFITTEPPADPEDHIVLLLDCRGDWTPPAGRGWRKKDQNPAGVLWERGDPEAGV